LKNDDDDDDTTKNENKNQDAAPSRRLGLKANINQFSLLILVNAFVVRWLAWNKQSFHS
jgi:hypothetical protein